VHNLNRVTVEIADHRPEVIRADVRPSSRGSDRGCASLHCGLVKFHDLLAGVSTHGDMATRTSYRFAGCNRIKAENPFSLRTEGRLFRRPMLKAVAKRYEAVRIKLNRLFKPVAAE
jgi:hypothetical protein